MTLTETLPRFFNFIEERCHRRWEQALAQFQEILAKEKVLNDVFPVTFTEKSTGTLTTEGWLMNTESSEILPLFTGTNKLLGAEFRMAHGKVFFAGKHYQTNDVIEHSGRKFQIKILPQHYLAGEGELS